ncbi:MAG: LysM peptidoglycan-binding domain-containing protein [Desulfosporosinus sp.]|nr:LysM peptidoglycan-binding domain-containing protein [Desulfosporosinus sp.]
MELRSVAYNPTPAPTMGGMMQDMQGMPGMQPGMQGMPGMQPGMQGMPGMHQDMQEMQPGMHQEMPEVERMLHGMHRMPGMPGAHQHLDYDPCCQMTCPTCGEPIMQQPTCPTQMPSPLPTPSPSPSPAHEVYVVKPGDSVYKIAKRYGTTMQAIILGNNLRNPDRIYPGEILYIPKAYSSEFRG